MDDSGRPTIAVCGVGGAGCNTINRLLRQGIGKAELIAFNTDKKHLSLVSDKAQRFLIGGHVTRGLGAGGFPEVAEKADISTNYYARIERGDTGISMEIFEKLVKALKVHSSDVLPF